MTSTYSYLFSSMCCMYLALSWNMLCTKNIMNHMFLVLPCLTLDSNNNRLIIVWWYPFCIWMHTIFISKWSCRSNSLFAYKGQVSLVSVFMLWSFDLNISSLKNVMCLHVIQRIQYCNLFYIVLSFWMVS